MPPEVSKRKREEKRDITPLSSCAATELLKGSPHLLYISFISQQQLLSLLWQEILLRKCGLCTCALTLALLSCDSPFWVLTQCCRSITLHCYVKQGLSNPGRLWRMCSEIRRIMTDPGEKESSSKSGIWTVFSEGV